MGERVLGEDALDSADGRQRLDPLLDQPFMNGLGTARPSLIVEMKPFQDHDLFYFQTTERGLVHT